MIEKVLIPLENVQFRGIDNKVRLRYRLVSKDKNESSQWSPIYTVFPYEIKSSAAGHPGPGSEKTNPILHSKWEPTSYSDGKNININIDSGWAKDKHVIPCNNFDVFISWNQFAASDNTGFWGHEVSRNSNISDVSSTVLNDPASPGYNPSLDTEYIYNATMTDISTKNIKVGDYITTKPPAIGSGFPGALLVPGFVTSILTPYSIRVSTTNQTNSGIVAGLVANVKKSDIADASTGLPTSDFVYAGTTNSGSISIQVSEQAFSENNSTQYVYILTPARNPPGILETEDQYGYDYTNEIYRSNVLTTEATVEPGENSNTYNITNIDGGTPT
jgi:hypothetical protein